MSLADVKYLPETPAHDLQIEAINDEAFGPGRFVLAAYKIRAPSSPQSFSSQTTSMRS